jgi:FAD/FMN-containing dehydrogenase
MHSKAKTELAEILRGTLIERDHPDYEDARKLYNGMIDKRPLMIARCADVADVIAAVNFGRENKLLIAIRGGGHNGPGLGSCGAQQAARCGWALAVRRAMWTTPPIPLA